MEWIVGIFYSLFGFLLLMGVLVTIHEFGHYYVARKLGFKVLTFSIGFGKTIWQRHGADGVNYRIGMIPLGGYVEMLDERLHQVNSEEMGQTFNAQPLWKRAAVVIAGPGANLLLAFLLLWGLYMTGIPSYKAYIDQPDVGTPFATAGLEAGDLITSVDGSTIVTIGDLGEKLIEHLGDGRAEIEYLRNGSYNVGVIELEGPLRLEAKTDLNAELGFRLYLPKIPPLVGAVIPNGVADRAGVKAGDMMHSLGGVPITEWNDIPRTLNQLIAAEEFEGVLSVERNGVLYESPYRLEADDEGRYLLGIQSEITDELRQEMQSLLVDQKYNPLAALRLAAEKTYEGSLFLFKIIYRMIKGEVHLNMMAGPLTIADIAGKSIKMGVVQFIHLLALLSINIGMINLLPLPILDGGRLVGFAIEGLVGRDRIPKRLAEMTMQLGFFFIIGFMLLVLYFDVTRWF